MFPTPSRQVLHQTPGFRSLSAPVLLVTICASKETEIPSKSLNLSVPYPGFVEVIFRRRGLLRMKNVLFSTQSDRTTTSEPKSIYRQETILSLLETSSQKSNNSTSFLVLNWESNIPIIVCYVYLKNTFRIFEGVLDLFTFKFNINYN